MKNSNTQILKPENWNNNKTNVVKGKCICLFQWIDSLQGKSWLSSTSPPSLTSPPSSPTQPTWCAPTFSKWFNLQDSHDVSFASTCPAFFLWMRWSSPSGLQVTATQRKKNWTTITTFLFPFVICLYLLLDDHQWFHALFPQAPCSSWLP